MKKKKNKAVVSGENLTVKLDGEEVAPAMPTWASMDNYTLTGTYTPTMSKEDYYKYTDMLYKAWKKLSEAGYKVEVSVG